MRETAKQEIALAVEPSKTATNNQQLSAAPHTQLFRDIAALAQVATAFGNGVQILATGAIHPNA